MWRTRRFRLALRVLAILCFVLVPAPFTAVIAGNPAGVARTPGVRLAGSLAQADKQDASRALVSW